MNAGKCVVPVLALVMLSGCATYPIATNLRKQAKPLTVSQVKENPESARGATVIWGGIVVNTVNNTNGGAIYIMELPLDPNEKPWRNSPATGEFIATSSQFLDPETFSYYALITVAGTVTGVRTEAEGKIYHTYPVVDIKDLRVWPIFPMGFLTYGTPGSWVGPNWWWYGGTFYPPRYDGGFCKGYGE